MPDVLLFFRYNARVESRNKYINLVNLNANSVFAYLVMKVKEDQSDPVTPGFPVMHWHEDLQVLYVEQGTVLVKTLKEEVTLQVGEGILINKNVVHMIVSYVSSAYHSILFPPWILDFYAGCPANAVVEEVTGSGNSLYVFRSGNGNILSLVKKLLRWDFIREVCLESTLRRKQG